MGILIGGINACTRIVVVVVVVDNIVRMMKRRMMIGTDIILHQRLPIIVLPQLLWLRIMTSAADFDVPKVFRRHYSLFISSIG